MLEDPRFKDNDSRVRNREALNAILQEWIGVHPLDEALETMVGVVRWWGLYTIQR